MLLLRAFLEVLDLRAFLEVLDFDLWPPSPQPVYGDYVGEGGLSQNVAS